MEKPRRLMNRHFLLLWQGQFVSQLGSQAFLVAMVFWIKRQTDSATLLGLVTMATILPAVLLGPIGGTFADRYSRRTIIIAADLIRGAASLGLALLVLAAPDRPQLIFPCLVATALINAVASSFFRPAINAAIPDLVPEERLERANSLNQMSFDLSTLLGKGVGGVLFRLLGPGLMFLINGLSYVFSGISECFIRIPQETPETGDDGRRDDGRRDDGWRQAFAEFRSETAAGIRYVWRDKGLRIILFLTPFGFFFETAITVLFPFYVEDTLAVGPDWYGFLIASFGGGATAGGLLAGATNFRGRRRCGVYLAASIVSALTLGSLAFATSAWVALALLFVAGLTDGVVTIHLLSLLQLSTPSHLRGRVFGLNQTLGLSMMALAAGLVGLVADFLDRDIRAIYLGCGVALALVPLILTLSPEARRFLAYEAPEDDSEDL